MGSRHLALCMSDQQDSHTCFSTWHVMCNMDQFKFPATLLFYGQGGVRRPPRLNLPRKTLQSRLRNCIGCHCQYVILQSLQLASSQVGVRFWRGMLDLWRFDAQYFQLWGNTRCDWSSFWSVQVMHLCECRSLLTNGDVH